MLPEIHGWHQCLEYPHGGHIVFDDLVQPSEHHFVHGRETHLQVFDVRVSEMNRTDARQPPALFNTKFELTNTDQQRRHVLIFAWGLRQDIRL